MFISMRFPCDVCFCVVACCASIERVKMQKSRGRQPETFMLFDSREVLYHTMMTIDCAIHLNRHQQHHSHHHRSIQINTPHRSWNPINAIKQQKLISIQLVLIVLDMDRISVEAAPSQTMIAMTMLLIITEAECSYSSRSSPKRLRL